MAKKKPQEFDIPQHEIDAVARCLLPEIQRYYESEEGKREFAAWKAERKKAKQKAHEDISNE